MTKPARFILSSDYSTLRVTGQKELSITIPNDFTLPEQQTGDYHTIGKLTYMIPSQSDSFYFYFSSSITDYTCIGWHGSTIPDGSYRQYDQFTDHEPVVFDVKINGSTLTFTVECLPSVLWSTRFYGYGQTITLHIITFKDPFSE